MIKHPKIAPAIYESIIIPANTNCEQPITPMSLTIIDIVTAGLKCAPQTGPKSTVIEKSMALTAKASLCVSAAQLIAITKAAVPRASYRHMNALF